MSHASAPAYPSVQRKPPSGRRWVQGLWIFLFVLSIIYGIDPWHVTRYVCRPHFVLPSGLCAVDFWKRWEVAALGATGAYALIFYIIGFWATDPQYGLTKNGVKRSLFGTIVEDGAPRGLRRVSIVISCMFLALVFIALATWLSFKDEPYVDVFLFDVHLFQYRPYVMQLLSLVIACAFFLGISWIMKEKSEEQAVRSEFAQSYRYNDWPVTIGFMVLFLFAYSIPYHEESSHSSLAANLHQYFKAFVGGAVAFQMIVSNLIFASVFRDDGSTQ